MLEFLFLAGFLAYGVGNVIATSIAGSADPGGSEALLVAGVALMLVNSVIVIGIGVLMFPILRPHNEAIAGGYLGTRIFEGVGLATGAVRLLVLTGPPLSTRTSSPTTSPRSGSVSAASSSALCSSAPDSFRIS